MSDSPRRGTELNPSRRGWRKCVGCSLLSDACPEDSLPVLRMDRRVDATAGGEPLGFGDACSGHDQVPVYHPQLSRFFPSFILLHFDVNFSTF